MACRHGTQLSAPAGRHVTCDGMASDVLCEESGLYRERAIHRLRSQPLHYQLRRWSESTIPAGMAQELNVITVRRREVEQEIARARDVITNGEKELAELDMAGAVIARLTGASWPPAGEADAGPSKGGPLFSGAAVAPMSLPSMIEAVLTKAHRRGLRMMEPKEIRQEIADSLDPNVKSEAVSSICWRMWKRGQLEKVAETAAYRLPLKPGDEGYVRSPPPKEKPADA